MVALLHLSVFFSLVTSFCAQVRGGARGQLEFCADSSHEIISLGRQGSDDTSFCVEVMNKTVRLILREA